MIEMLAGQLQELSMEQLLKKFESEAQLDGTYFFCNQEGLMQIAKLIKGVSGMEFGLVLTGMQPHVHVKAARNQYMVVNAHSKKQL